MLESSSWCLFCRNNSALSYCSCLNRPFPLISPPHPPPSWRQQLIHPWADVCAATACSSLLCCILFSVSHVVPYSGNCSCPAFALSFFTPLFFCLFWLSWSFLHRGAKLKPSPEQPELDSARSRCLMCHPWPGATKLRGSRAQQPWPESALLHNSDSSRLTPVLLLFNHLFIYLFACLSTNKSEIFFHSPFAPEFLCCCDSLNEEPLLSRHLAVSGLLWFPCFSVITAENVLFNCVEQGSCAWCLGLPCIVYT